MPFYQSFEGLLLIEDSMASRHELLPRNSFALLDQPDAVDRIASSSSEPHDQVAPQLDDMPDHLLELVLSHVIWPLRSKDSAAAHPTLQLWMLYRRVSKRWRRLVAEQPLRLRIGELRWEVLLKGLHSALPLVLSLELYLGGTAASEAARHLSVLLDDRCFQRRCHRHLQRIVVASGLPAAHINLGVWSQLRHVSQLSLESAADVEHLRKLPPRLESLTLVANSPRCHQRRQQLMRLGAALEHLTHLRLLQITSMHVSPALLPKKLMRVRLAYCTLESQQRWEPPLTNTWEGPMHSAPGLRTLLMAKARPPIEIVADWFDSSTIKQSNRIRTEFETLHA